jgi:glycerophosphoryl diester phosphodiesterase
MSGALRCIAHRGGAREVPENTVRAFRRAAALGCDALELDLRATADDAIVVLHDPRVDRVTEASAAVEELSLAEVRALDAAHWFSPGRGADRTAASFPLRGSDAVDLRIPTLEEVLLAVPDVHLVVDLKVGPPAVPWFPAAVAERLATHGRRGDVTVGSFDQGRLDAFRVLAPDVATSATREEVVAFFGGGPAPAVPRFTAFQVPARYGELEVVTPGLVERAHAGGHEVHVWTVDDPAEMRRLADLGVDGLITDVPSTLLQVFPR